MLTLAPVLLIGAIALGGLAYYSWRFSGNPLRLPYTLYRDSSTVAPHFIFQAPRPAPVFRHRALRDFYLGWEVYHYEGGGGRTALLRIRNALDLYRTFYLGPVLTVTLLALPRMLRRRRARWLVLCLLFVAAGLSVEVWALPHYAAPALGLALLIVVEALRHWRVRWGAGPVWILAAGSCLAPVIGGSGVGADGRDRAQVVRSLERAGGRHLVIVRYSPSHDSGDEWVYNSADIDSAPIVWAREMDPTSNRELLDYFHGRSAWLVQPDRRPVPMAPYDFSMRPDPPFAFVPPGTEGITVLRDPERIRRDILHAAEQEPPLERSCDRWNYLFTAQTGIGGPDPVNGCFPPGDRAHAVSLDDWYTWLRKQR